MEADVIREKYEGVLAEIEDVRSRSPRAAGRVKLVVVTKGQAVETIRSAFQAGVRLFGENYPEETDTKLESLGALPGVEWHMIGHLQSRKARIVAQSFDMMHSLDSLALAVKLNHQLGLVKRNLPVLLEVNVGGEGSKYGYPAWDESGWNGLLGEFEHIGQLENLHVLGLMTMPPIHPEAELARPYFIQMRRLRDFLRRQLPGMKWEELSMGTSSDYPVAVEEGATFVRVGTAIVGARPRRE